MVNHPKSKTWGSVLYSIGEPVWEHTSTMGIRPSPEGMRQIRASYRKRFSKVSVRWYSEFQIQKLFVERTGDGVTEPRSYLERKNWKPK